MSQNDSLGKSAHYLWYRVNSSYMWALENKTVGELPLFVQLHYNSRHITAEIIDVLDYLATSINVESAIFNLPDDTLVILALANTATEYAPKRRKMFDELLGITFECEDGDPEVTLGDSACRSCNEPVTRDVGELDASDTL